MFGAFASMVVLTRLLGGDLPDRIGPARVATAAAIVETLGLVVIATAESLVVALVGALAMGAAFSLLYPSLSLIVVDRVPVNRRGAALGTFTAFFDAGVGLGAPAGRHRRRAQRLRGRLPLRRLRRGGLRDDDRGHDLGPQRGTARRARAEAG